MPVPRVLRDQSKPRPDELSRGGAKGAAIGVQYEATPGSELDLDLCTAVRRFHELEGELPFGEMAQQEI